MRKWFEYDTIGSRHSGLWLRLLVALVVASAGWLAMPKPAQAGWTIVGEKVSREQVIEDDVLATGTDVVIEGTINGDLIAIGSTVTLNGSVSGSVLAVGRTVDLNGQVGGSTYIAARTLNLGDTALVVQDVHFAGLLLDGQPGSRVERDLGVATLRARISSQVGRALSGFILLMTFDGQVGGDAQTGAGSQSLDSSQPGRGVMPLVVALGTGGGRGAGYAAPRYQIMTTSLARAGRAQQEQGESEAPAAGIPEGLVARLSDLLILLLVGGLAMWLRPALVLGPAGSLRREPLPAAAFGLLAVVLSFGAAAVGIALAVLVLIAGIWLGSMSFWGLAFILWAIGYPALFLAFAAFALTLAYGTKVIVASLVGTLILKRLAPRALERPILPLLLGLVLYLLLRSIPVLGWVVEVVVTILGLGAIWVAYRHRRPAPAAAAAAEQVRPALALEA